LALYRAGAADGVAWVTGASTGIGRHLALDLAKRGYTVAATARNEDRLAELAREAGAPSGRIIPFPCDVTDEAGMRRTVEAIEAEAGPIVLAVFNAGAYFPVRGDALHADNIASTYQLNMLGVVHGLVPAVERMDQRGRGHIAIVGSVAAYGGLPMAAAYGASKAALNHMAASLKFDFDKMNIRIQIINPGFVDTPLTKNGKFPMPALLHASEAAERIVRGLERGGFEVTFPRRFTWLVKLMNLLPYPAYFALVNRAMGWRKRPLISRKGKDRRP
jgi:NAD(P)-dependent dehydrogenase (short-subunit alcohol dehydrogenase family)